MSELSQKQNNVIKMTETINNSNGSTKDVVDFVRKDLNLQQFNNNNKKIISQIDNQPIAMTTIQTKQINNNNNSIKTNSTISNSNNNNNNNNSVNNNNKLINQNSSINSTSYQCALINKKGIAGTLYGDCEVKTGIKSSLSTLEKFSLFKSHSRKRSDLIAINNHNNNNNNSKKESSGISINHSGGGSKNIDCCGNGNNSSLIKDRPKFVKSASIARLLGNNYNTKKQENYLQLNRKGSNNFINNNNNLKDDKMNTNGNYSVNKNSNNPINNNNNNNNCSNGVSNNKQRRFSNTERFHKCTNFEEDKLNSINSNQAFNNEKMLSAKAFRTISRSLGKLWWKRTHSIEISAPDPEYKVSYLGNVLTGWAKGEGCVEKPLNTLWRNYTQNHKPDVLMRVRVCASGLKATTRQHGLTEYWAHRITHCCAPKNYPRVFCWVYRHEGRKLKHEMRCHAVLCSKESIAQEICNQLRENLDRALREFRREKISRQNARLSLANAAYENPSLPRRKILLSVGGNNYRPPLERSKSAPKLMAIEEAVGEEDGEEIEQTNEPEMPSCCQKDSLYPAMTLGRRRCRRGHSIRRTGKCYQKLGCNKDSASSTVVPNNCVEKIGRATPITKDPQVLSSLSLQKLNSSCNKMNSKANITIDEINNTEINNPKSASSHRSDDYYDDDDDLDKFLNYHNYENQSKSLAEDLLTYFDMKLKTKTSSLTNLDDCSLYEETLNPNPLPAINSRTALSLDNLDSFSDGGEDCVDEDDDDDVVDDLFYQQSAILNLLHRNSIRKISDLCINDDDHENKSTITTPNSSPSPSSTLTLLNQPQQHFDSDEGSISSGCETASTVTANLDDTSLKYQHKQLQQSEMNSMHHLHDQIGNEHSNIVKNNCNNDENHNLNLTNHNINFKLPQRNIRKDHHHHNHIGRRNRSHDGDDVSDSEFSDESGYVEFQEQNLLLRNKSVLVFDYVS